MLELIILFFGARHIGNLAERKGEKRGTWIFYTVIAWIVAELIGAVIGVSLFGNNLIAVMLFALFCAFGGGLLVHSLISKKPDISDRGPDDLL